MNSDKKKKSGSMAEIFRILTCVTQFGISMLVPMVLCFLLGLWIDGKLETYIFSILLFFVGAAAGARNVYALFKKYAGLDKEKEQ